MEGDLAFRDAVPSEDDELARIMYNAFLPIWYVLARVLYLILPFRSTPLIRTGIIIGFSAWITSSTPYPAPPPSFLPFKPGALPSTAPGSP